MTDINTSYNYYYPYIVAKANKFLKHYRNSGALEDFLLGENQFISNERMTGWSRKLTGVSREERLRREYLWKEFELWKKWCDAGKNIISFSFELLKMLEFTDVEDVVLDTLYLPYNNFYLSLKPLEISFGYENSIVDGVYIIKENNPDKDDEITYDFAINFHLAGNYEPLAIKFGDNISESFYFNTKNFSLTFDKQTNLFSVSQAITDHLTLFRDSIVNADSELKEEIFENHKKLVEKLINVIINCLLYLSLPDKDYQSVYADETPGHLIGKLRSANTKRKREVAKLEIQQLGFTKINLVGHSYIKNHSTTLTSTNEVFPHWRRGHWRNQKFGEQLNNSKLIWIKPTIVNKDSGIPQKGHIYSSH